MVPSYPPSSISSVQLLRQHILASIVCLHTLCRSCNTSVTWLHNKGAVCGRHWHFSHRHRRSTGPASHAALYEVDTRSACNHWLLPSAKVNQTVTVRVKQHWGRRLRELLFPWKSSKYYVFWRVEIAQSV
jgi:hypothetical protein